MTENSLAGMVDVADIHRPIREDPMGHRHASTPPQRAQVVSQMIAHAGEYGVVTAEEPLAALRWHLHHLRATAPGFISRNLSAVPDHIGLSVPTDVALFRDGAGRICESPGEAGAPQILALYRDDLLAGLTVSTAADRGLQAAIERNRRSHLAPMPPLPIPTSMPAASV